MAWKVLQFSRPSSEELNRLVGTPKFYADHNVDQAVVYMLRYLKYDVQTASDIGSQNQPDEFQYKRAYDSKRVLLTLDKDFLDDAKFPFSRTYGIVVLNIDTSIPGEIARALEVIHFVLGVISPVLIESKVVLNSDFTFSIISREATFPGWRIRKNRYKVDAEHAYLWED
jgi:predicted nuclease of predicted toxin-antitoxin system